MRSLCQPCDDRLVLLGLGERRQRLDAGIALAPEPDRSGRRRTVVRVPGDGNDAEPAERVVEISDRSAAVRDHLPGGLPAVRAVLHCLEVLGAEFHQVDVRWHWLASGRPSRRDGPVVPGRRSTSTFAGGGSRRVPE